MDKYLTAEDYFRGELTRQRYQLQRATILESLRKWIKKPESEKPELDQLPPPPDPLSRFLRP